MDILILSHLVPYPTTSGVLLRCYNLLREVARHHRVHLFALNQGVLLEPGENLFVVDGLESFRPVLAIVVVTHHARHADADRVLPCPRVSLVASAGLKDNARAGFPFGRGDREIRPDQHAVGDLSRGAVEQHLEWLALRGPQQSATHGAPPCAENSDIRVDIDVTRREQDGVSHVCRPWLALAPL